MVKPTLQMLALESLFENPLETESAKASQSAKVDLLEAAYDAIMDSYNRTVPSGRTAAGQCLAAPAGAAAAPAAAAAAPAAAAAQAKK